MPAMGGGDAGGLHSDECACVRVSRRNCQCTDPRSDRSAVYSGECACVRVSRPDACAMGPPRGRRGSDDPNRGGDAGPRRLSWQVCVRARVCARVRAGERARFCVRACRAVAPGKCRDIWREICREICREIRRRGPVTLPRGDNVLMGARARGKRVCSCVRVCVCVRASASGGRHPPWRRCSPACRPQRRRRRGGGGSGGVKPGRRQPGAGCAGPPAEPSESGPAARKLVE